MPPTHIIQFDQAEMIVRMREAYSNRTRPSGRSAEQLLAEMDPDEREAWKQVMRAIRDYWDEIIFHAGRIQ